MLPPVYIELPIPNTEAKQLLNLQSCLRISARDDCQGVNLHQLGVSRLYVNVKYTYLRDIVIAHEKLRFAEFCNLFTGMPTLVNMDRLTRVMPVTHWLRDRNGKRIRKIQATLIDTAVNRLQIVADSLYPDVVAYLLHGTPLPTSPLAKLRYK